VSSLSASGRSSGKTIIAIILVVLAVLLIIAAIIFFVEPAHSLPSIMGKITHPYGRAHATRPLHGAAAIVAAIVCLVAAFFVNRSNKPVRDGERDPVEAPAR
jgi:formate hydrogenlyase subunit 3/multisubunit Na+/H+ antiporter MnhD subunit